ncbi:MAG: AAA family ATPase [Candidatus Omnitrophota bacterium]|nr:AAA family ATPase [Candidatus Omnitrophota bacterium]
MYKDFFELKEKPFNVTPDPKFLFYSRKHQEAFSHLVYGIEERKGFIEITGEIGAGKTTLCRALLSRLDKKTKTALILNSNLSPTQMLKAVVDEFAIIPKGKSKKDLFDGLNEFLIEQLSLNHNVVLIIDESQNLTPSMLEQIRLLSNMETEKEKLIQVVLVGQPELRDKLKLPSLRQLRQRISIRYHITSLDCLETRKYIFHRLNIAGSKGNIFFNEKAIDDIFGYSKGIPRLINMVCDKSLLAAYVMDTKKIDGQIIDKCIEEIEGL